MDKFVPSAIATVIASTLAGNALANDFELPDGMERIVVTATGLSKS